MPKEEPHLKDIRKLRMEKRTKRFSTQPSTIYWQVLGAGCYGGPTSLYLHTDHRRYLFNCGEGTQRLTSQLSLSRALATLEHVFITSKSWRHLGGLPGLCLSCRAAGAPGITIHGPRGCMDLYEATKAFVTLFEFDVEAHNAEDGAFEDGGVRVETIVLKRATNLECPPLGRDWREDEDQGQWQSHHYDSDVQAYLCNFSPRPGKLDIDKCVEFGIKPGPVLGKLKSGQDVTLEDGRVVKSTDVVGESSPASSYLILDLPSMDYAHNLKESKLADLAQTASSLDTVFHFSPPSVFNSPEYRQFCDSLGPAVRHVVLNESCRGLGMADVSAYSHKLRTIRTDLFPRLQGGEEAASLEVLEAKMHSDTMELGDNVVRGVTGLKINVRPHPENEDRIKLSEVVMYDEAGAERDLFEGDKDNADERADYKSAISEALEYAKKFSPPSCQSHDSNTLTNYPIVTFLGTGSSVPSKYRNVSCILLETAPDTFIMLDCGEGSLGQMVRVFGVGRTREILAKLRCVYISHMHADHHLGLINIIQARAQEVRDPEDKLVIISTDRLMPFLTYYHTKFEPLLAQCEFVKCERLILYNEMDPKTLVENPDRKLQKLYPAELSRMLENLGLSEFYTSRAIHCPNAFCVAFRTKEGYKVAYSGDTRPCEKFREIARWGGPPDLLIHEATMEHFMMYDAIIKKHTTFTEAIKEGQLMGAKFTMLTHFSQRYAKMPLLGEIEGQPNVGIAFDTMSVSPRTFNLIPSLYPALSRWLADYVEELFERAEQYKQKHEPGTTGIEMDDDIPEDLMTPWQRKKLKAEQLSKKHEEKHQWFLNVKKRKLMENQQEAEKKKKDGNVPS